MLAVVSVGPRRAACHCLWTPTGINVVIKCVRAGFEENWELCVKMSAHPPTSISFMCIASPCVRMLNSQLMTLLMPRLPC